MYWGWHGFGGGGMFLMMVMMALFWGGLIILAIMGIWAFSRSRHGLWRAHHRHGPWDSYSRPRNNALDILKKRYASGEITREQYEEMRDDIFQ